MRVSNGAAVGRELSCLAMLLLLMACIAHGSASRVLLATRQQGLGSQLLSRYLTNEELSEWMNQFVGRCGSISRKFSIGASESGTPLYVLELSNKPGQVEAKPNFQYIANMHGDETSGRMLLPQLAEFLCASYNKDRRATSIIKGMHLFLMPTMNPGEARCSCSGGGLRGCCYYALIVSCHRRTCVRSACCFSLVITACLGPHNLKKAASAGLQELAIFASLWWHSNMWKLMHVCVIEFGSEASTESPHNAVVIIQHNVLDVV